MPFLFRGLVRPRSRQQEAMAIHGADVVADPALERPAGYHPSRERPTIGQAVVKRRRAAEEGEGGEGGEEGEEEGEGGEEEGGGGGDLSAAAAGSVWPAQVHCCLGSSYHSYHGCT
jgi:hypothetical protein